REDWPTRCTFLLSQSRRRRSSPRIQPAARLVTVSTDGGRSPGRTKGTHRERRSSDAPGGSMRYLITGGAGFIGSHLADRLVASGGDVVALDNLSTGRHSNIEHLEGSGHFRFVHGSVLDELAVDELVRECDIVVHLAAAVGVALIVR